MCWEGVCFVIGEYCLAKHHSHLVQDVFITIMIFSVQIQSLQTLLCPLNMSNFITDVNIPDVSLSHISHIRLPAFEGEVFTLIIMKLKQDTGDWGRRQTLTAHEGNRLHFSPFLQEMGETWAEIISPTFCAVKEASPDRRGHSASCCAASFDVFQHDRKGQRVWELQQ